MSPEQEGKLLAGLGRIEATLVRLDKEVQAITWRQNYTEKVAEQRFSELGKRLDSLGQDVHGVEDTQRMTAITVDNRRWDVLKAAIVAGLSVAVTLVTNVLLR